MMNEINVNATKKTHFLWLQQEQNKEQRAEQNKARSLDMRDTKNLNCKRSI